MTYPEQNNIEIEKKGTTIIFKSIVNNKVVQFHHNSKIDGDCFSLKINEKWYIQENKPISALSEIFHNKENDTLTLFLLNLCTCHKYIFDKWGVTINPRIYAIEYIYGTSMPIYKLRHSGVSLIFLSNLFSNYDFSLIESSDDDLRLRISINMANDCIVDGDTKGAIKALFYNQDLPSSIQKVLLQLPHNYFSIIKLVLQAIDVAGIDNVRNILTKLIVSTPIDFYICVETFLKLLIQKISAKKIIHFIEKIVDSDSKTKRTMFLFLHDISVMTNIIIKTSGSINKPNSIKSINDYHNYLSALVTEIQLKKAESYKKSHVSLFPTYSNGKYNIRPISSTSELIAIGCYMHHCVASYMEQHAESECEILVVTPIQNSKDYLACIELKAVDKQDLTKDTYLNQAKLKYNKPLSFNSALEAFIQDYCYLNKILFITI